MWIRSGKKPQINENNLGLIESTMYWKLVTMYWILALSVTFHLY
jgi:hypothetical protein